VWRRYIASTSGRVGFLVIEALPTRAWDGLLDLSLEARSR
jgi:hypothetical protein